MSLPGFPFPKLPADERLAALDSGGRCIDLAEVDGGNVLHTGFGYGPEFWLVPAGVDADAVGIDYDRAEVVGARLITTRGEPISSPDALVRRGAKITVRIPQI